MSATLSITERLSTILEKVGRWRTDAEVIRALAEKAAKSRAVSEQQLLSVEETSAAVFAEIAAFDRLAAGIEAPTELEMAMVADVGDALRLLSLEITELSTALYAAHSAWALDDGTPNAPALDPASEAMAVAKPADGDVWS